MSNFILIGAKSKDNSVLRKAVFGDIADDNHPHIRFLYSKKPSRIGRAVQRVVTSKKLNRYIQMPLRTHWEANCSDVESVLSATEDNYVIFVPGTQTFERISPVLLKQLKKKHPECKLVYYFIDGVERTAQISQVSEAYLLNFLKQFDYVCTYSRLDAKKYGFDFIEIPVWHAPFDAGNTPVNSLHFSGADKKRVNLLVEIKKRLDAAGISYNFQITPTQSSDTSRKDISYSAFKPYEEVVRDVTETNCALEILAMFNTSATLRYKEAVIYNKKLLTNNPEIFQLPYYDERWMRYFEKAEDIDLDWVKAVEPVDYGYKGDFSTPSFLQTVETMYHAHSKS